LLEGRTELAAHHLRRGRSEDGAETAGAAAEWPWYSTQHVRNTSLHLVKR
jgi:hypothetical protein